MFPEHYNEVRTIEIVNDVVFSIDILLSFFKIKAEDMITLRKTALNYLT